MEGDPCLENLAQVSSCFTSQIISCDRETNKFWLDPAVLQIAFFEFNLCAN